jgi:hypothetical protein
MKRWVVIAAMGLVVGSGIVAPGARASSAAWYQVYQARSSGFTYQVAAVSRTNMWAVARTFTRAGKTIYRPFIRHFTGRSWRAVTIPHAAAFTADWVSASAANNVWVGGLTNARFSSTSAVYRWNGARWKKIPLPAWTDLAGVVVLAPNNVWAYGSSASVYADFFHWNGSRWQHFSAATNFIPQAISASGPGNVWVSGFRYVGKNKEILAAYRWHAGAWHTVRMPHPVLNDGGPGVTAVSPANVWIGWADIAAGHVLHWNGHHWLNVALSSAANPGDIVPDGKGGYWFGPQAILTGTTWTSEQLPGIDGGFAGLARIPGTTSFLLAGGVETGTPATERPTVFRFDL